MSEAPVIVLDPQGTPAVVIATPGVVVITETDRVTISDDYILTIGD